MENSHAIRPSWLLILLFLPILLNGQEAGPVITDFGKVYQIDNPDIPSDYTEVYKAVFDVYDSPSGRGVINPQLETAARYLNLHVKGGIAPENLKVALVVHGKATEDLLRPQEFLKKHGTPSANAALVRKLLDAGVSIAVCGQSATSRQIGREQTIEGVQWALSAMTALVHYQNKGYRFIKF